MFVLYTYKNKYKMVDWATLITSWDDSCTYTYVILINLISLPIFILHDICDQTFLSLQKIILYDIQIQDNYTLI